LDDLLENGSSQQTTQPRTHVCRRSGRYALECERINYQRFDLSGGNLNWGRAPAIGHRANLCRLRRAARGLTGIKRLTTAALWPARPTVMTFWSREITPRLRAVTTAFAAMAIHETQGIGRHRRQIRGAARHAAERVRLLQARQQRQCDAYARNPSPQYFTSIKHSRSRNPAEAHRWRLLV
jgi:hypothetical protein